MEFALGVGLGIVLGKLIYKWGTFDLEAEAFVSGYDEGYHDALADRPPKWGGWLDWQAWRRQKTDAT